MIRNCTAEHCYYMLMSSKPHYRMLTKERRRRKKNPPKYDYCFYLRVSFHGSESSSSGTGVQILQTGMWASCCCCQTDLQLVGGGQNSTSAHQQLLVILEQRDKWEEPHRAPSYTLALFNIFGVDENVKGMLI